MTDTPSSRSLFWGLVALAVGLVLAGFVTAGALKNLRRTDDDITVTGSAKRPIRADYAVWRPSLSAQNLSVNDAFQQVQSSTASVVAFLKAQGVPDSSVTLNPVETSTVESYNPNGPPRPPAYRVTQNFEIRLSDVDAMTKLARASSTLVSQGVPLTGSPPEYIYTKLADIRIAMLGEATKDARMRAERIAQSVDLKLGKVRGVRLGVFQITPRNSTEVSDMGVNDVTSVDKDITAVVRVDFGVE
jgi:hypothetical protein